MVFSLFILPCIRFVTFLPVFCLGKCLSTSGTRLTGRDRPETDGRVTYLGGSSGTLSEATNIFINVWVEGGDYFSRAFSSTLCQSLVWMDPAIRASVR